MADNKRTPKGTFAAGKSGNPSGRPKTRADGWASAITGIGNVLHDKRTTHDFVPVDLSYEKCTQIFESDDLGRRAAVGPVQDAFRQGYEITIADEGQFEDLKEDIENRLRELEVDKVIKKAMAQKRALGGSAILIGARDNKAMDRPLNRKTVSDIEFLTNLEPMDLVPHTFYDDPVEPKFGEVKLWQLQAFGANTPLMIGRTVKTAATEKHTKNTLIHESRLIIFNTGKISKYSTTQNPAGIFWGLSIYTQIYDILRDFNVAWSAAGLIVTDFSQAVFSVENLMQLIIRNEDQLVERMRAMNMGRSVARAVLIDTNEKFSRESVNISGLPELLNQLSRRFAAAIDTPLSVLMGGGSKSDSSEMGDDLRYYYDKLSSLQRDEIGPVVRMFAEIIMRGLRQRKIPKKWGIKWHPLWQLTDEQKANARLAQARVDAIYIKHGVLDTDTVAKLRFAGEYSFDTSLSAGYKSPGFTSLPPMGVLVNGMDPKTGLPPGEVPPEPEGGGDKKAGGAGETGAHGVSNYSRRNPRQTSMAGSDTTAGGDTAGKADDQSDIETPEDSEILEVEIEGVEDEEEEESRKYDGPQIETLANIAMAVAAGDMSAESAMALMTTTCDMTPEEASAILGTGNNTSPDHDGSTE